MIGITDAARSSVDSVVSLPWLGTPVITTCTLEKEYWYETLLPSTHGSDQLMLHGTARADITIPMHMVEEKGHGPALTVDVSGKANNPVLAPRLKMVDVKGRALMIHVGGNDHPAPPRVAEVLVWPVVLFNDVRLRMIMPEGYGLIVKNIGECIDTDQDDSMQRQQQTPNAVLKTSPTMFPRHLIGLGGIG